MTTTLLTLIRHGQTSANVGRIWHGTTDTPLSDLGHAQAARAARHVAATRADAVAIYASPLQRARHTAEPIAEALGLQLRIREDLHEYDLGEWEGRTFAELAAQHRLFERMAEEPDWQPGGGESARQVAHRLGGALREIAGEHPGERSIVVTHAGALTLALGWLIEGDLGHWRQAMGNAALSDLDMTRAPTLQVFNEDTHLADLAEPGT